MFLTVCLNPTLQKTLQFSSVTSGAVNRTGEHRLDVSGKGINVTRVLTQLGKKAVHLTQLGGDMRPLFLSLCEQDGLDVQWVESNSQIRFCYTLLTENDNCVTELVEESQTVDPQTEPKILDKFDNLLENNSSLKSSSLRLANLRFDASARGLSHLIISGKNAAGFSDNVIPYMVKKAKEKGLFVILDIRGNDLINSLKYEPDVIKPNMEEFIATFGIGTNDPQKLRELVLEIAQKHNCRIILTNGDKKILAAEKENFYEIEVPKVKAVNTIGCGDAFTAGLASALENGADFKTAINEGIRCGTLNAGLIRPGVIKAELS
ncbi:MAG: PfkB family carbohydrate kinase [Treponema sp.]|nr:PfkB family carbohydrate kinase [Treponema sp.]